MRGTGRRAALAARRPLHFYQEKLTFPWYINTGGRGGNTSARLRRDQGRWPGLVSAAADLSYLPGEPGSNPYTYRAVTPRQAWLHCSGGEGGIRTLDTLADIRAFQARALGH